MYRIIAIIMLLFSQCNSTKCLSTTQCANVNVNERFTFYNYNNAQVLRIKGTATSNNFYEYIQVSTPAYSAIRKIDTSDSSVWEKVYQITPCQYSFDVLPDETSIYSLALSTSQTILIQYEATTGAISNGYKTTSYVTNANSILSVSPDSQSVYMSLLTITTSIASLCKFTIGGTNFICSSLSGINLANGLVGIDNNKVFKISTKTAQPSSIKFKMIDFTDNTNIEKWSSSISCPGASCTTYHSEAILISADSKVGVLVGYNNLLLFLFLNIQTGAAANSGYKTVSTSGSCSNSISLKMIGNYIIGIFKCAKNYIFVFDYANTSMMNYIETTTTTLNFLDGYYTGSYAYLAGYFTSGSNNIGHIGKGSISAIVGQDNLYYSSFSTQILTNSDYPLTSDSITTTTASTVATSPVMTFTVDTSSFYYPDATTYTTDISFWLNTLYYTQSDKTVNIPLTCSVSGSTSISYSIQQYSTYELPSWVSLDSTNMILTINAPTISATTIYGLKIVSTINSKSYPKIIYITVAGSSSSSSGGTSSSSSTNSTSSSSTSTSSTSTKAKTPITTTVKSTMIATQSAIGSGMAIGLSTSILTSSSAQGIWTFMNQFQMFLILNLLGADFPQDIKDYLDNMSFSTFSFDFIPTYNFPLINIYYGYFSCDEENQDYLISGINYSCSIINNAQLFLICVTYACLHLIIYLIYLKLNQLMNFLGKIIRKVYEYMTFNIYLRTLVEGFLFLYLSTLHEIYLSDFNKSGRILSFVLGVLIYIMLLALSLFVIYQWYKSLNSNFDIEKSKFSELFEGLKETKCGKLFHTVFLMRRILSASWIVLAQEASIEIKVVFYWLIQATSLIYIVSVRPFKKPHENLIEALNDMFYIAICTILLYYNSNDKWTSVSSTAVISLLSFNGVVILVIQLGYGIISLLKYLKSKFQPQKIEPECVSDESKLHSVNCPNDRNPSNTRIVSSLIERDLKESHSMPKRYTESRISNYMSQENHTDGHVRDFME